MVVEDLETTSTEPHTQTLAYLQAKDMLYCCRAKEEDFSTSRAQVGLCFGSQKL
jgi:hypothetical protein